MKSLTDLTAEVRFGERRRGYDYDEVDDYVKSVNRAATQALARLSELHERIRQLEARQSGADGAANERETLVRTLVLAQRAADTAVAEARQTAAATTDEARESAARTVAEAEAAANSRLEAATVEAARMLAEAEENCRAIIAETKRTAAAEMAQEREQINQELQVLAATKSELSTEVEQITARLENERATLQKFFASFRSFVEAVNEPKALTEQPRSAEQSASTPRDHEFAESIHDSREPTQGTARPVQAATQPPQSSTGPIHGSAQLPQSATEAIQNSPAFFDVEADEEEEFIEQLRRVASADSPKPDSGYDEALSAFFDPDETKPQGPRHRSTPSRTTGTVRTSRFGRY